MWIIKNFAIVILFAFLLSSCKNNKESSKKNNLDSTNISINSPKDTNKMTEVFDTLEFIEQSKYNGKYLEASMNKLSDRDFRYVNATDLRLIRNEIFARYGYKFKSKDLQEYFSKFDWYKPIFNNVNKYLTKTEKININKIKEFEKNGNKYTQKKQFNIFLNYFKDSTNMPLLLSLKFGTCTVEGFSSYPEMILFKTQKYTYIYYENNRGCSDQQCFYSFHILKFSTDGTILDNIFITSSSEPGNIEKIDKNSYKLTYENPDVYNDYDDKDVDTNYVDNSSTEIFVASIDKNENLTLKEANNNN